MTLVLAALWKLRLQQNPSRNTSQKCEAMRGNLDLDDRFTGLLQFVLRLTTCSAQTSPVPDETRGLRRWTAASGMISSFALVVLPWFSCTCNQDSWLGMRAQRRSKLSTTSPFTTLSRSPAFAVSQSLG